MRKILEELKRNVKNIPGKKTSKKIVSIYADDFGSVRVKNKKSYDYLKKKGIPMDSNKFSKYDTLMTKEDLNKLFDVLTSVKDVNGNYACLTPFVNIANPDFEKIRKNNYSKYFREPFTATLEKYGNSYEGVYDLWQEGISNKIFYPAYHGTEHFNVRKIMKALKLEKSSVRAAFDVESVCVPSFPSEKALVNATATFDIEESNENEYLKNDIIVGTKMFYELLGYRSKQFTPGAGIYSPHLHKTLRESGIEYINVERFKAYPLGNGKFKKEFLYNGKVNSYGIKYIIRNCVFEPEGKTNSSIVDRCIKDIEASFRWHSPAIISTHRVNYVGTFDKKWRDNSLVLLKELLAKLKKKHPDIIFANGDKMAETVFGG